ncbi:MAG: glyoxalase [Gammaproteobacteria bacterium]|nr:glyoxalase [Gammaproteobacteria bacterium]
MPITDLNHYFVRSKDLERTRHFYCDVLGFEVMPRPDFPFPGYWFGVAGKVQVHVGLDRIPDQDSQYLGSSPASATENSGVVDHIAFEGTDPEGVARRLTEHGLSTRMRYIAEVRIFQIFVADPDGLMIELNFPGIPAVPSWADAIEV